MYDWGGHKFNDSLNQFDKTLGPWKSVFNLRRSIFMELIEEEDIHFFSKRIFIPISCVKLGLNYRICFWKLPFKMCTHCKNSSFKGSCWCLMKWFYTLFLKRAKNVNNNIQICKLSFYSLLKYIFSAFLNEIQHYKYYQIQEKPICTDIHIKILSKSHF